MIHAKNLNKTFVSDEISNHVLKGIDLKINEGEFVSIMGRSGAGKSTLLYQISLLDRPDEGSEIYINGDNINYAFASSADRYRNRLENQGYVFQSYALLPELTAYENVALPMMMQGFSVADIENRVMTALERVGLEDHAHKLPSKLSGGEQQRVSIARAVAHEPHILFADEPTANLDTKNARDVLAVFEELHRAGQTIVMVTHAKEYGLLADRLVTLSDGRIISDRKLPKKRKSKRKKT